jgi:hypothetical protein
MHTQNKYRRSDLRPAILAAIVSIAGTAVILVGDLGPGNASEDSARATMITAAAVSRAGAIETPSAPAVRPLS